MNDLTTQSDALPALPRPLPAGHRVRRETLTLGDGYVTSVYIHAPAAGQARLPVLYVHGIQSHPGWFMASAAALAQAGHPVYLVQGTDENIKITTPEDIHLAEALLLRRSESL